MSGNSKIFVQIIVVFWINVFGNYIFSVQKQVQSAVEDILRGKFEEIQRISEVVNGNILRINEAMGLAHSSNATAIKAFQVATDALALLKKTSGDCAAIQDSIAGFEHKTSIGVEQLEQQYQVLAKKLLADADKECLRVEQVLSTVLARERCCDLQDKLKLAEAKIEFKSRRGIYDQVEKIRGQSAVEVEGEKWRNIHDIIGDHKLIIKLVVTITVIVLTVYLIKYGIPALINCFMRPHVISETSKKGFWGWLSPQKPMEHTALIFAPQLQKRLVSLALHIKSARELGQNLPNILFGGPPGTGKTAFVRLLAYASGLDYALTSGSEFAKITDLNTASNEFKKLLNWAKKSQGLIIFIDEAESLFASRKFATTTKITQDFINTFLSLIPEQSQKNFMFIFATNHPFKIDDAIINRIGESIEFTLPGADEIRKIMLYYLYKYADRGKEDSVCIPPAVIASLPNYALQLKGCSPRMLKFIVETIMLRARSCESGRLSLDIFDKVIDQAKQNLKQIEKWEAEQIAWNNKLSQVS